MGNGALKTILLTAIWTGVAVQVFAQFTVQHQVPVSVERNAVTELQFMISGLSANDIQSSLIFYRYDGEFAYQQQEVQFQNGVFVAQIEIEDSNAGQLEYYFEVTTLSGERYTYPDANEKDEPAQVQIRDAEEEELAEFELIDYTILSPKPGAGMPVNDMLFSLAFFFNAEDLSAGEIRLYIDDVDVTAQTDTSAYYYAYVPDYLRPGPHRARLTYKTPSEEMLITEWQFFVIPEGGREITTAGVASSNIPDGMAEIGARNQIIGGDVHNAYTGRTQISGSYGSLRYTLNTYLTSQESSRLQPQNRYGANIQYGEWWRFNAGHVFPMMSRFTISGRRIHGVNTSVHLLKKSLNFQFLYGELDRRISNQYGELVAQEVTTNDGTVVDTSYTLNFEGRGTFKRNVIGGRIGIGNEEKFQIGIHALKVRDDTTSLFNVRDYMDLSGSGLNIGNSLSNADRVKLQQNPNLLNIQGGSVRPKDNIVMGSDIKLGLFNNRIRFESEAVLSALNDDIYNGPLNAERAEEMGFEIDSKTTDLLEKLSWLIIVNENMNTLPIRLVDDANGDTEAEMFFPTSILAGSSELSVRYPRNNLRLQYRWIGPNFNSLANSTIRRDVAGFTLTDRMNLLSNRLYLTLGLEQLQDNVTGSKEATTTTNTYRTNLSWYPIERKLPRVSFGIRYRQRDNGVERFNPEVPDAFETAAVQNLRINSNGDTLTTTNPRLNNTLNLSASVSQQFQLLDMVHDASINLSNLKTTDEVFAFGGVSSSAITLNISTRFNERPLITQFGLTFNNTESGNGQSTVKIFGIYAGGNYRMMENRLSLNGRLAITNNNTSSRSLEVIDNNDSISRNDYYQLGSEVAGPEFNTFVIQAGAQYDLNESHSVLFDANFTNVTGQGYSNDRVVQLRYVFRF